MRFSATWWFFASKGSKYASESDIDVIRNSKIEPVLPYKSLTNQDIALRFGQLVLWTISIKCGFLLHDGFLPLRGRKRRWTISNIKPLHMMPKTTAQMPLATFCAVSNPTLWRQFKIFFGLIKDGQDLEVESWFRGRESYVKQKSNYMRLVEDSILWECL